MFGAKIARSTLSYIKYQSAEDELSKIIRSLLHHIQQHNSEFYMWHEFPPNYPADKLKIICRHLETLDYKVKLIRRRENDQEGSFIHTELKISF